MPRTGAFTNWVTIVSDHTQMPGLIEAITLLRPDGNGGYVTYYFATRATSYRLISPDVYEPRLKSVGSIVNQLGNGQGRVTVRLINSDLNFRDDFAIDYVTDPGDTYGVGTDLFIGSLVTIRKILSGEVSGSPVQTDLIYAFGVVSAVRYTEEFLELDIATDVNLPPPKLSNRRVGRKCSWVFKGSECGYSGGLTTCNKLYSDSGGCSGRSNQHRFGGFPARDSAASIGRVSGLGSAATYQLIASNDDVTIQRTTTTFDDSFSLVDDVANNRTVVTSITPNWVNAGSPKYRVSANISTTTGSITSSTTSLTVADASTWKIGHGIRVVGAASIAGTSTLNGAINSTVTTITLASTTNFPSSGLAKVDSEVVYYNGKTGTQLQNVSRAYNGTTAASHSNGATITPIIDLVTTVTGIAGSVLTLDDAAGTTVSSTFVFHDDTAAIQEAFDDAYAAGRPLYIPAGDYPVTKLIFDSKNRVVIMGDGPGRTALYSLYPEQLITIDTTTSICHTVSIENLGLIGAISGARNHGIEILDTGGYGVFNLTLRNLRIHDMGGSAIKSESGTHPAFSVLLEGIDVDQYSVALGHSIDLWGSNDTTLIRCYVHNVPDMKAAYRVRSGSITMIGCNGIDGGSTATWGLFGNVTAEDGTDNYCRVNLIGCNIEKFTEYGIRCKSGSYANFFSTQITAPDTGTVTPIKLDYVTSDQGGIFDALSSVQTLGATYANSQAIHSNGMPFVQVGHREFTTFYDTSASASATLPGISGTRITGAQHYAMTHGGYQKFTGHLGIEEQSSPVTPPSNSGFLFAKDASGQTGLYWVADGVSERRIDVAGGSTSPGGADTQVQFNDAGNFGGDAGLTYLKASDALVLAGEIRFTETGGGTDYVGFKAPSAITTSRIYTLPSADGSSGQALTTDGNGVLSWTTVAGAGVTSVSATAPIASSGGATPTISLNSAYGDTLNPYGSKTANFFLAAPNGTSGVPSFRAIAASDVPILNQNTTGTAANVTGVVAIVNGGTGATTATNARTNLLPSYTSNALKFLRVNSGETDVEWASLDGDKGDITVTSSGATWTIDAGVVSLAKMADLATQRVIGRSTAGTGTPEALTASQVLDFITNVQGSILYRGASNWSFLGPGTLGQFLKTQGSGADPAWATVSATPGGSNTQIQYNDSSSFNGSSKFTYVKATDTVVIGNELRFTESSGGGDYVGIKARFSVTSVTYLLPSTDGGGGQVLTTDGSGGLSWTDVSTSATTPGGSNTQVQYNDSGAFGGDAGLTYDETNKNLTVGNELRLSDDDASNYIALKAPSNVTSNVTLTLPSNDGDNGQVLITDGTGGLSWGTPSAGVTDGDKGDITVSGSGATWTIDNDVVTYAKIQNVTDNRLLGRSAGTSGDVQEITVGSGLSLAAGSLTATGASLTLSTQSPTTADITGAVNTRYRIDISGLTATRSIILPTATAGDIIEISISTGDNQYELIVKGATSPTPVSINGGSPGDEWSRLFITNEFVQLVAVSSAAWIVTVDGRIPCQGIAKHESTSVGTVSAVNATTDTLTVTAHGLNNGDSIRFTGTPPTGLLTNVVYWVRDKTTDTFKVGIKASSASAVDFTGTATGAGVRKTQNFAVNIFAAFDLNVTSLDVGNMVNLVGNGFNIRRTGVYSLAHNAQIYGAQEFSGAANLIQGVWTTDTRVVSSPDTTLPSPMQVINNLIGAYDTQNPAVSAAVVTQLTAGDRAIPVGRQGQATMSWFYNVFDPYATVIEIL